MAAFDRFLTPLQTLTQRLPEVEAHVFWHAEGAWADAIGDVHEAGKIAFYAEGLLAEGFGAAWQHLVSATGDAHLRLLFWQSGAPDLPLLPQGWLLVVAAVHPA